MTNNVETERYNRTRKGVIIGSIGGLIGNSIFYAANWDDFTDATSIARTVFVVSTAAIELAAAGIGGMIGEAIDKRAKPTSRWG